jgi:hypothetical protein
LFSVYLKNAILPISREGDKVEKTDDQLLQPYHLTALPQSILKVAGKDF